MKVRSPAAAAAVRSSSGNTLPAGRCSIRRISRDSRALKSTPPCPLKNPYISSALSGEWKSPKVWPISWLAAEVRPHVDTLTVTAPDSLAAGTSTAVTATVAQANRTVPVAYPVSARWSASPNVHIGSARDAKRYHVATFDPATGELTALRPATITLAVTVNGVTTRHTLTIVVAVAAATG